MLSDLKVRNAKPSGKIYKLFDSRGLYLEVSPSGHKWWRLKYRFSGKENRISLGVYPEVRLKDAREQQEEMRKLLSRGVDPSQSRKAEKAARANRAANDFEAVARDWYLRQAGGWSPVHKDRLLRLFERDIFPWIGSRPIAEIEAPELLTVIRRIEDRGAIETAHRALSYCGWVFRYGISRGLMKFSPAPNLKGALVPTRGDKRQQHLAAVTEPRRLAEILRAFDGYQGMFIVRCALRLAPLVFVRPGELRRAEWKDIDLEAAEWRYLVTKTHTDHIVPLSRQGVAILREIQPLTGNGRYVFPGARSASRPMSDNAILAAMRRMGIPKEEMSGHGFRAAARTILDEVLGFRTDLIEHQLAHAVKDPNGTAYNRTAFLPERRKMMQKWADYLGKLKAGAEVVEMPSHA